MSADGSRQRLLVACACLACASAFTAWQFRQFSQSGSNLAKRQGETALAQMPSVPVATVPTRPGEAQAKPPPMSDRLAALMKAAQKGPGGVPLVHPEDLFVDHPQLERTFLEAMRGRTRLKYGPFFAQAGLSEQEIESFCQAYADSETRWTELNKLAFQRGIPRTDPSITELERKASEERKAHLATLLGAERSAKLQQYQDEDGGRQMLLGLGNLVATTYRSKEPVTSAQIEALVGITNEFHIFSPQEAAGIPGAFDQAEARARRILTPDQMDVFNLLLDAHQVSMLRYLENKAERGKP